MHDVFPRTRMMTMKTAAFALFFLFAAAAAFGQAAPVLSNTPSQINVPEHPQHASQHAMADETSLLGNTQYSYAQGEQPLTDFATAKVEIPLGDVARAYRQGHVLDKKAKIVVSENN